MLLFFEWTVDARKFLHQLAVLIMQLLHVSFGFVECVFCTRQLQVYFLVMRQTLLAVAWWSQSCALSSASCCEERREVRIPCLSNSTFKRSFSALFRHSKIESTLTFSDTQINLRFSISWFMATRSRCSVLASRWLCRNCRVNSGTSPTPPSAQTFPHFEDAGGVLHRGWPSATPIHGDSSFPPLYTALRCSVTQCIGISSSGNLLWTPRRFWINQSHVQRPNTFPSIDSTPVHIVSICFSNQELFGECRGFNRFE